MNKYANIHDELNLEQGYTIIDEEIDFEINKLEKAYANGEMSNYNHDIRLISLKALKSDSEYGNIYMLAENIVYCIDKELIFNINSEDITKYFLEITNNYKQLVGFNNESIEHYPNTSKGIDYFNREKFEEAEEQAEMTALNEDGLEHV